MVLTAYGTVVTVAVSGGSFCLAPYSVRVFKPRTDERGTVSVPNLHIATLTLLFQSRYQ